MCSCITLPLERNLELPQTVCLAIITQGRTGTKGLMEQVGCGEPCQDVQHCILSQEMSYFPLFLVCPPLTL